MNHGLKLHQDGTLEIILPKGKKVSKVLIGESGKQGLYYQYGELIRCSECKHWYSDADTGMACEYTNMSQPEEGYCNWSERRTYE